MSAETQAAVEAAREELWLWVPPQMGFERAFVAYVAAIRADERTRYEALVEALERITRVGGMAESGRETMRGIAREALAALGGSGGGE